MALFATQGRHSSATLSDTLSSSKIHFMQRVSHECRLSFRKYHSHVFSAEAISRWNDWMFGRQLVNLFCPATDWLQSSSCWFFFFFTKCASGAFNLNLQSSSQDGLFYVLRWHHKDIFMSRVGSKKNVCRNCRSDAAGREQIACSTFLTQSQYWLLRELAMDYRHIYI